MTGTADDYLIRDLRYDRARLYAALHRLYNAGAAHHHKLLGSDEFFRELLTASRVLIEGLESRKPKKAGARKCPPTINAILRGKNRGLYKVEKGKVYRWVGPKK